LEEGLRRIESEVFVLSMFFLSFVVYVGLVWYERADEPRSDRYLLLASYLVGLSIGVHQLSLLCFFTVATFVYVRRYLGMPPFVFVSVCKLLPRRLL